MTKGKTGKQNGPELLGQYVKRIMEEKGLGLKDVQVLSGDTITDAYVANIVNGNAANPSVDKLKALALGLGVDEDELFLVARGISPGRPVAQKPADPSHTRMILKLMEKVVMSPRLTRILQEVVKLSAEDQEEVKDFIESKQKSKPGKHPS
jgi:transcriptional regulator with XRE-family HTH domain